MAPFDLTRLLLLTLLEFAEVADIDVSTEKVYNVTTMTYGVNTPNYINGGFVKTSGDAMLKATGATHLRWPGGNWANMIIWNNDYSVCPYFTKYAQKNKPWTLTWSQAGEFATKRGIDVLWQMNAAVGLVCGPEKAAALAAAFVKEAIASGVSVNYIEVGNENYGKWEVPYPDKPELVSPARYASVCAAVVKAVKAVKSSVMVGCVGDLVNKKGSNSPFLDWDEEVLAGAGAEMDFLIIHEYYTKVANGDTSPWNLLNYGCAVNTIGVNCGPHSIAATVQAHVKQYAPSRKAPLPVMITEYNMEQPFKAETWALVEGLFTAKHLGESMEAGLMGTTFFALANSGSPDYGMFSKDAHQVAYAPVFSFAIFSRVAPVGSAMLSTTVDVKRLNITVYAFSRPEVNCYGVVLVNMGTQSKTISLSGPWDTSSDLVAAVYTLTASSKSGTDLYSAASFAYNGVAGASKGGPLPLDGILPKRIPFTGSITLDAVSVTGLVITPSSAPFPPPAPTPPPPAPAPAPVPVPPGMGKCCYGCCTGQCHESGWCSTSAKNCESCSGRWCKKQLSLIV